MKMTNEHFWSSKILSIDFFVIIFYNVIKKYVALLGILLKIKVVFPKMRAIYLRMMI